MCLVVSSKCLFACVDVCVSETLASAASVDVKPRAVLSFDENKPPKLNHSLVSLSHFPLIHSICAII